MKSSLPAIPDSDKLSRALATYGLSANADQIQQILSYLKLLLRWNEKLNLTAIRDPIEIIYRHFCESMFAANSVPLERGRLADVGSGGGFPGLPLKIFRPELEVVLIESNIKKATFLAEVIRELSLSGARVIVERYEELHEQLTPLEFVCARALGEFDRLLAWAASDVLGVREVVLWVGGRDLAQLRRNRNWLWREEIHMPHSLQRYLLVGERIH